MTHRSLAVLFVSSAMAFAQIPKGTGAAQDSTGKFDLNWSIVANTVSSENIAVPAPAPIVLLKGNGWGTLSGTTWIAPDPDQSNNTTPQKRPGTCCNGTTTYELQFAN